jgi:hypothetical protein
MNEEQIVLSLIAMYKREGIDLHQLLDEPLFNALPVQRRIELIRMYAKEIHAGIHSGVSSRDVKSFLKGLLPSAFGGAVAGFGAAKAVSHAIQGGRMAPGALVGGAIAGASFGAGIRLFRAVGENSERRRIKEYFGQAAQNPTDGNAIQAIGYYGLRTRSQKAEAEPFNKILDKIDTMSENYATGVGKDLAVKYNAETVGRRLK